MPTRSLQITQLSDRVPAVGYCTECGKTFQVTSDEGPMSIEEIFATHFCYLDPDSCDRS